MRNKIRLLTAGFSVISLLALSGCGTNTSVNQQTGANNGSQSQGTQTGGGRSGAGGQFGSVSKVLNMSMTTLMNALKGGLSIVEIAGKQGITQQTLISDLESSYKSQMDLAVSNGRITSTQEQQMISRYDQNLPNMIEHKGLPAFTGRGSYTGQTTNQTSTNTP